MVMGYPPEMSDLMGALTGQPTFDDKVWEMQTQKHVKMQMQTLMVVVQTLRDDRHGLFIP